MTLSDHIATGVTTLCYCWVVTRKDGVIVGLTDHDEDVTVNGTVCSSSTGMTTTRITRSLGLDPDDMEVEGAIDDDALTREDLRAGKYDGASVTIHLVNWSDPTQYHSVASGEFGNLLEAETGAFTVDFRSAVNNLNQPEGRAYQRSCDAKLGDSRCGVDLNDSANSTTTTVVTLDGVNLTLASLSGFDDGWFDLGRVVFADGSEAGIKSHKDDTLTLWFDHAAGADVASNVTVFAGCRKDAETCRVKFGNILNFQGFHLIPGNDRLTAYPIVGQDDYAGESLFE